MAIVFLQKSYQGQLAFILSAPAGNGKCRTGKVVAEIDAEDTTFYIGFT